MDKARYDFMQFLKTQWRLEVKHLNRKISFKKWLLSNRAFLLKKEKLNA